MTNMPVYLKNYQILMFSLIDYLRHHVLYSNFPQTFFTPIYTYLLTHCKGQMKNNP